MKTKTIPAEGATLYSCSLGEGDPLIIAHGGSGLTHHYLRELSEFAVGRQLIFYDQRACGQSGGTVDACNINLPRFVEDLDAVRRAYGLDKVSLLGHSWGGLLVARYAIEHPSAVERLIFMNSIPVAHTPDGSPDYYMDTMRAIKRSEEFQQHRTEKIVAAYKELFRPYFKNPGDADKLKLGMSLQAALNNVYVREEFERTLFEKGYNFAAEISRLNIPALVVHGESDLIPLGVSQQIYRLLSGSELVCIKECGHFPHIEKPVELLGHLRSWWAKHQS